MAAYGDVAQIVTATESIACFFGNPTGPDDVTRLMNGDCVAVVGDLLHLIVNRWQAFSGKAATLDDDGRSFDEVGCERVGNDAGEAKAAEQDAA